MKWNHFWQWMINVLEKMKIKESTLEKGTVKMKKTENKTEKITSLP